MHIWFCFFYYFRITLTRVIEANVAAAVVLISMGALLGRITPIQLLCMALIEIVVYAANEYFQLQMLKVISIEIIIIIDLLTIMQYTTHKMSAVRFFFFFVRGNCFRMAIKLSNFNLYANIVQYVCNWYESIGFDLLPPYV